MLLFAYFKVGGVWRREKLRREAEILNKKRSGHQVWIPEGSSGGGIERLGRRGSHSKEDTSFSGYCKEGMVFWDEGSIFLFAQH